MIGILIDLLKSYSFMIFVSSFLLMIFKTIVFKLGAIGFCISLLILVILIMTMLKRI